MAASIMAVYLVLITLAASHHLVMAQAGLLKKPLYGLLYCFYQQRVWLGATALFMFASSSLALHKLKDMIAYSKARRGLGGMASCLAYLALGLLLLYSGRYAPWQQLLLAIAFLAAPYLFTHQDIQNPTRGTKHSIHLLGKAGQTLPLNAPELGVCIVGAPGSGKTKYVIEPLLYRMIAQGYAGLLYDYDFSAQNAGRDYSLTHLAYHCCKHFTKGKTRFVCINFEDLFTSARINPIAPPYIQDRNSLTHILRTLLLNMQPGQQEDFWYKNTYALLKGVVIFLANNYPQLCTLPHVIIAGLQPIEQTMAMLQLDQEATLYASPILDAYKHAPEQLAGVMANFKVTLDRLLDPHIFWVLSGNDTPHIVNDPAQPTVVCLGNTPTKKESLGPILAMLTAFLSANMYGRGRPKSFLMLDELPTLFLPQLAEVPATARKYGMATIVALQNLAQLEKRYGMVGAAELQDTFSNHLTGRSQLRVAKEWSERVGKQETHTSSHTISKHQESETIHEKEKTILTPQESMHLAVGEFVGSIAASDQPFFRMKLRPISHYHAQLSYASFEPLPITNPHVQAQANFLKIQQTVKELVGREML